MLFYIGLTTTLSLPKVRSPCRTGIHKVRHAITQSNADPYAGILYRTYKSFLIACIRARWLTVFVLLGLLGFMSLMGMMIKNAIVLIDEINAQLAEGAPPFTAIVQSGVSRPRPVSMAAMTTVLGMIPLLVDAFFASMAVTIMFDLTFATLLTLIVIPVLYAIFFRIKNP